MQCEIMHETAGPGKQVQLEQQVVVQVVLAYPGRSNHTASMS